MGLAPVLGDRVCHWASCSVQLVYLVPLLGPMMHTLLAVAVTRSLLAPPTMQLNSPLAVIRVSRASGPEYEGVGTVGREVSGAKDERGERERGACRRGELRDQFGLYRLPDPAHGDGGARSEKLIVRVALTMSTSSTAPPRTSTERSDRRGEGAALSACFSADLMSLGVASRVRGGCRRVAGPRAVRASYRSPSRRVSRRSPVALVSRTRRVPRAALTSVDGSSDVPARASSSTAKVR